MAQLEVSARGPRRRHDLCPLDTDPEAPSRGRGADLDRRLAGGRPHRGWRSVRRRRGRGQGEAPRGAEGAAPPGARSGSRHAPQTAWKAATCGAGQRAGAGDPRDRGATRFCGQARAGARSGEAAEAEAPFERHVGAARGAFGCSICACLRTASCPGSSLASPLRGHRARRPEPGHPPPPPNLGPEPNSASDATRAPRVGTRTSRRGLPASPGTRSPGE